MITKCYLIPFFRILLKTSLSIHKLNERSFEYECTSFIHTTKGEQNFNPLSVHPFP